MLLQHGADPNIRNTDGKSALDLADPSAKAVLTGQSLNNIINFSKIESLGLPIFLPTIIVLFENATYIAKRLKIVQKFSILLYSK